MPAYCFDTSALLKRWLDEVGADRVRALTAICSGHRLYAARLAIPEALGAIARRHRAADIAPGDRARLLAAVRRDMAERVRVLTVSGAIWAHAAALAERRCLRGADAVHLAVAMSVRELHASAGVDDLVFVTADGEQAVAARAEGMQVENPAENPA